MNVVVPPREMTTVSCTPGPSMNSSTSSGESRKRMLPTAPVSELKALTPDPISFSLPIRASLPRHCGLVTAG
jgi:hypothetical protein